MEKSYHPLESHPHFYSREYSPYFRIETREKIEQYLSSTIIKGQQRAIDNIALAHRELTKTIAAFRYRSKAYSHQLVQEPTYRYKLLHPSLESEFNSHIENWEMNKKRQADIQSALTRALSIMGNTRDLALLLPDCIKHVLPSPDAKEQTLLSHQIEEFQEEYAEALNTIKVQVVMKSLEE